MKLKPYFTVVDVFRVITLDWDWDCTNFDPTTNKLILLIRQHSNVKEIWYRCSANGHIHIKIVLHEPVDFWESIYLRAKWDDDANRIRMDIVRWWENGEVMRLWDAKLICEEEKGCVLRKAGPWVKVTS